MQQIYDNYWIYYLNLILNMKFQYFAANWIEFEVLIIDAMESVNFVD